MNGALNDRCGMTSGSSPRSGTVSLRREPSG